MTTNISSLTAASTASTSSATSASSEVLGKEDFLILLVAQMQNQDPLNPNDPTEFTAQLAQFSSLEQLTNLNGSMTNLLDAYNQTNRLSTLSTIGKEVVYYTGSFEYSGEQLTLGYNLDGPASEVTLSIKKDGVTVAVLEGEDLSKGTHYLQWDGTTANGEPAPMGDYEIVIEAKGVDDSGVAATPLLRSLVTGVDLNGPNGGVLETSAGATYFNLILGVFEPGKYS